MTVELTGQVTSWRRLTVLLKEADAAKKSLDIFKLFS